LNHIDCDEVLNQLSEYIDEETRAELCEAIQAHLASCQDCQIKVDTVKKTIVLYQNHSPVELPVRVTARLSAALAREYSMRGEPNRAD
jgi:anti-sigma factor (TIGR02949 family)